MTHLTDGDIRGFIGGRLSRDSKRQTVAHLLTGCWSCRARLTAYGDVLFPREGSEKATADRARSVAGAFYDGALQRAWLSAQAKLNDLRVQQASLEALWAESFEARYRDPLAMEQLAAEATRLADRLDAAKLGAGVVADLRARAWGEYGNALRVRDDFERAEACLTKAFRLSEDGTADPLLYARLTDIKASLFADRRRLDEAIGLVDEVQTIYLELGEEHLAGRAAISKGTFTYWQGEPRRAAELVRDGLELLEPGRDPLLEAHAEKNLVRYLADSGNYTGAAVLLLRSGLRERLKDDPLSLIRLRWIEGSIAAGLGRLDRAERALLSVREQLLAHRAVYDFALAGLELAAVWLRQGEKASNVRSLAEETYTTLDELGVGPEALKALTFLREACANPETSLAAVTTVREFLLMAEQRPQLAFRPA